MMDTHDSQSKEKDQAHEIQDMGGSKKLTRRRQSKVGHLSNGRLQMDEIHQSNKGPQLTASQKVKRSYRPNNAHLPIRGSFSSDNTTSSPSLPAPNNRNASPAQNPAEQQEQIQNEQQRQIQLEITRKRQDAARAVFKAEVTHFNKDLEYQFLETVVKGAVAYAPSTRESAIEMAEFFRPIRDLGDDSEVEGDWKAVDFTKPWLCNLLAAARAQRAQSAEATDTLRKEALCRMYTQQMPNNVTDSRNGLLTVAQCLALATALQALRSWHLQMYGKYIPPFFQRNGEMSPASDRKAKIFISSFGRFPFRAIGSCLLGKVTARRGLVAWPHVYIRAEPTTERKTAWQELLGPTAMNADPGVVDEQVVTAWIVEMWENVAKPWLMGDGELVPNKDWAHQQCWLALAAWPKHAEQEEWDLWSRGKMVLTREHESRYIWEAAQQRVISWTKQFKIARVEPSG